MNSKDVVRRYFADLDRHDLSNLSEFIAPDCIVNRIDTPAPLRGIDAVHRIWTTMSGRYPTLSTDLHSTVAEGDLVVCHLTHHATQRDGFKSRLGMVPDSIDGKPVNWQAMAMFRVTDGKISEMWVMMDELGILLELGFAKPSA